MLEIKPGTLYINKTYAYLAPVLNSFDQEFQRRYRLIRQQVLAYAIQDFLYNDAMGIEKTEAALFVVVQRPSIESEDHGKLERFLAFFRTHGSYVHDYLFDGLGTHCLVIDISPWRETYCQFEASRFSRMYIPEQLEQCCILPGSSVHSVLTRNPAYLEKFKEKLRRVYNLDPGVALPDDYEEYELPVNNHERLNSGKDFV